MLDPSIFLPSFLFHHFTTYQQSEDRIERLARHAKLTSQLPHGDARVLIDESHRTMVCQSKL